MAAHAPIFLPERGPRAGSPDRAEGQLCFRFQAGDRETRAILEQLCTALGNAGLHEDDLANTELVLAEVLNNIVEHAYAKGGGVVELRAEPRADGVACLVRDLGRAMPEDRPPRPDLPAVALPDGLPEGGFGWHIIRCLTRDLHYRRVGACNELSFLVPYGGFG